MNGFGNRVRVKETTLEEIMPDNDRFPPNTGIGVLFLLHLSEIP